MEYQVQRHETLYQAGQSDPAALKFYLKQATALAYNTAVASRKCLGTKQEVACHEDSSEQSGEVAEWPKAAVC